LGVSAPGEKSDQETAVREGEGPVMQSWWGGEEGGSFFEEGKKGDALSNLKKVLEGDILRKGNHLVRGKKDQTSREKGVFSFFMGKKGGGSLLIHGEGEGPKGKKGRRGMVCLRQGKSSSSSPEKRNISFSDKKK